MSDLITKIWRISLKINVWRLSTVQIKIYKYPFTKLNYYISTYLLKAKNNKIKVQYQ